MRRRLLAGAALACLAVTAAAQEPDPRAPKTSKDGRQVFVPYEDFGEVLKRDAKGVLLTREQFDELRKRAQGNLSAAKPRAPKLESAEYTAEVRDLAVQGRVTFVIKSAGNGVQLMPLGLGGLGVTAATLNGKPALVARKGTQLLAVVEGGGTHTLVLDFTLPVDARPDGHHLQAALPLAPVGKWSLTIPGEHEIEAHGAVAQTRVTAGATTTEVVIGGRKDLHLQFRSKVDDTPQDAVLICAMANRLDLDEQFARLHWRLNFQPYRSPVGEFTIPIPAGWQLDGVTAPDLVDWLDRDGRLTVKLRVPVEAAKSVDVDVRLQRALRNGALDVPFPEPTDVLRRAGWVDIFAADGVRVRPLASTNVRESNAPRGGVHRYHFDQAGAALRLSVERPAPKLLTALLNETVIAEDLTTSSTSYLFEVIEGRLFEVSFALAPGVQVSRVDGAREWSVNEGENGARTLLVRLPQPVQRGQRWEPFIEVRREHTLTPNEAHTLPWIAPVPPGDVKPGNAQTLIARDPALEIRELRVEGAEPIALRALHSRSARRRPGARFAYELKTAGPTLDLAVTEATPQIELVSAQVIGWDEETIAAHAVLDYAIKAGAARELQFLLPAGTGQSVEIHAAAAPAIAERSMRATDAGELWTVRLAEKARQRYRLLVSFRGKQALGAKAAVALVRAAEGVAQRGFLGVQGGRRLHIDLTATAMREIDRGEVPATLWSGLPQQQRLIATYRFDTAGAGLVAATTRFADGAVATAVIQTATTRRHIDPQRGTVTEVLWVLRESGLQSIDLPCPPEAQAEVLAITVDGEGVKPTRNPGGITVPLPGQLSNHREVRLLYLERGRTVGAFGSVAAPGAAAVQRDAAGAAVAIPVFENRVELAVPDGYRVLGTGGSMHLRGAVEGRSFLRTLYEQFPVQMVGSVIALLVIMLGWALREQIASAIPMPGRTAWLGAGLTVVAGLILFSLITAPTLMQARAPSRAYDERAAFKSKGDRGLRNVALEEAELDKDVALPGAPPIEDPVVKDSEEYDHNETDSNEEYERSAGADDAVRGRAAREKRFDNRRIPRKQPRKPMPKAEAAPAPDAANEPAAPEMPGDEAGGEQKGRFNRDGIGAGGGAGGKFGGRAAQANGQVFRAGGTGPLAGLKSLDVNLPLTGTTLAFDRGAAGGTATMWVISSGAVWFLSLLLLVGGVALPIWARTNRPAGVALIPFCFVALTLLPEVAPGLAGPCNAGVLGLSFGCALLVLAAVLRSIRAGGLGSMAGTGAALLVAAVVGLSAQDAAAQGTDPSKLPEGTIFVPYDPAKVGGVGELGSKVYLPYEAFLKLYAAAHPDRVPVRSSTAIGGHLRADYRVALEGEWLEGEAEFSTRALGNGWVEVPLGMAGAQIVSATVDGSQAALRAHRHGVSVLLKAPGTYRVVVGFRSRGSGSSNAVEGQASFGLAGAPLSHLELTLRDAGLTAQITGAKGAQQEETGRADVAAPVIVRADLGAGDRAGVKWKPRSAARAAEGLRVRAESLLEVIVRDYAHYLHLNTVFHVAGGERDSFSFTVAPELRVLDVTGQNLRSWSVSGAGAERRITVAMNRPVKGSTQLHVRTVQRIDDGTAPRPLPRLAPEGVQRESGAILFRAKPHHRWSLEGETRGLVREGPERHRPVGDDVNVAAFRFPARPFELTYSAATKTPQARGRADSTLTLLPDEARLESVLRWERKRGGALLHRVTALVPAAYTVRRVTGENRTQLRTWWLDPAGADGRRRLHAVLAVGHEWAMLKITAARAVSGDAALDVPLPRVVPAEVERLTGSLRVQTLPGRSLTATDLRNLTERPAGAGVLAYEFRDADHAGRIGVKVLTPRRSVRWAVHTKVAGAAMLHALYADFTIETAPARELEVEIPGDVTGVEVLVEDMREQRITRTADGRQRVRIVLQEPVEGIVAVAITASARSETEGAAMALFTPAFPGIEAGRDTGYVLLEPLEQRATLEVKTTGLEDLRPGEDRNLPGGVDRTRVTKSWKVADPAWGGTAALKRQIQEKGAGVSLDLLELETTISAEGQARTRAVLHMQNRELQFLPLQIPVGARLLSLFVAGEPSKPNLRAGDGPNLIQVPLPRRARGDLGFTVTVTYTEDLGELGTTASIAPRQPSVPTTIHTGKVTWTVRLPDGYKVYADGNMTQAEAEAIGQHAAQTARVDNAEQQVQQLLSITKGTDVHAANRALSNFASAIDQLDEQLAGEREELQQGKSSLKNFKGKDAWVGANEARYRNKAANRDKLKQDFEQAARELEQRRQQADTGFQQEAQKKQAESFTRRATSKKSSYAGYGDLAKERKQAQDRLSRLGRMQEQRQQQGQMPGPVPQGGPSGPSSGPTGPGAPTPSTPTTPTGPSGPSGPTTGTAPARGRDAAPWPTPSTSTYSYTPTTYFPAYYSTASTKGKLSLRVDLPTDGTAHHFHVTGGHADLKLRVVKTSGFGFLGRAIQLIAVMALLFLVRRRGFFGRPGADLLPQVAAGVALCTAAGAALANWPLAAILCVICGAEWLWSRRQPFAGAGF